MKLTAVSPVSTITVDPGPPPFLGGETIEGEEGSTDGSSVLMRTGDSGSFGDIGDTGDTGDGSEDSSFLSGSNICRV